MNFFNRLTKSGLIFNNNQKEAITHVYGPLLVAAGPGSGKTSVITARTAYLIQQANIDPSKILVITFTRAAANEMKTRFRSFPGITTEHAKKVDFGTFHSTFYKIINTYYGRHLPVLDRKKAYTAVKDTLRSLNEPFDDETVENAFNDISLARTISGGISDFRSEHFSSKKMLALYNSYESFKHAQKCIDFDDMIIMCKKLLESDENLLQNYRRRYNFFLVDEFQDTNRMQLDIIKILCSPDNNICVVGDDDQSIYGFRGSMPGCLLDFEQYYSPCKTVILDTNYRSTSEIIEISKKVISNNTNRKDKDLNSYRGCGRKPVMITPPDEESESAFIADTIEEMRKQGLPYGGFAVLYRTNIQSRPVIDEFIRRNIPFKVKDSINNFFNHWICRDITSYLRLAAGTGNASHLARIINRPVRYITKESVERASVNLLPGKNNIVNAFGGTGLKDFQLGKITDLESNLKSMKFMSPSSAVTFIRRTVGYNDYLRNYSMESNIEISELYDILDEYEMSSSGFNTIPGFLSHINEVSEKLSSDNTKAVNTGNSVTLTTIHSAKGLEFPCVFVSGAIEGLLPHKKSINTGENIEEERRLFYVAITRARDALFISAPRKYHGKSANCSRFYIEASEDIKGQPDSKQNLRLFSIGELVCHKIFGTGKITGLNKAIIEIQFNSKTGRKQLDLNTCVENKLLEK